MALKVLATGKWVNRHLCGACPRKEKCTETWERQRHLQRLGTDWAGHVLASIRLVDISLCGLLRRGKSLQNWGGKPRGVVR